MILEIREYVSQSAFSVVFGPDEDHLVSLGQWAFDSRQHDSRTRAREKAEVGLKTASEMLNIYKQMFHYKRTGSLLVDDPEVPAGVTGD